MEMSNDQIIEGALALPPQQREQLIDRLLASLAAENESTCRPAWIVEIRRRLDEVRSGRVQSVPSDEAFERVRRAIRP